VIRASAQDLREDMFSEIAKQARMVDAKPLPDVMIFPEEIMLETSRKNIYGVLPPSTEDAQRVEEVLFMDDRAWWMDRTFAFTSGPTFTVGRYDGAVKLNNLERSFARALDEAEFVLWWHRNPDKKAYAVRVVRSEHEHYFYPDFVVCLNHFPDDLPMQRLLETKESTKDASRKAQHSPAGYGKVLFLTPDGSRLRWVQDNGSVGDVVDLNDMGLVLKRFAATRPVAGH
jgi:type III restriction enzyme